MIMKVEHDPNLPPEEAGRLIYKMLRSGQANFMMAVERRGVDADPDYIAGSLIEFVRPQVLT